MDRKKDFNAPIDGKEVLPFSNKSTESEAMSGFTSEVTRQMKVLQDQMADPLNCLKFQHGKSWSGPAMAHAQQDGEFKLHSHQIETKFDDILSGDLTLMALRIDEITEGMNRAFSELVFTTVQGAAEKVGNIVQYNDEKTSPDTLIEVLQKIKFSVDRDGQVSLPSIFASPDQLQKMKNEMLAIDSATQEKLNETIEERKLEALADEKARQARFERTPNE